MIQLGSNIKLEGFEDIQPGQLVVVKKIIGSFAKKVADSTGFDSFEVYKTGGNGVTVKIAKGNNVREAKAAESNLFFSLSKALVQATG